MMRILLPALALLYACNPGSADPPGNAPTFEEVGQIYEARCIGCHQDGGISPFRLDNYEDAGTWADVAATVTANRSMPPFLVVGDGTCGDFADSQWLTDEELATIAAWAEAGAPEGNGHTFTVPELPGLSGGTHRLQTPDFLPEIVGGQLARFDEYRCFAIDVPTTTDMFLTGYEVIPGNDAIVHHVVGMPVDYDSDGWYGDRTNGEIIASLSDPAREGWPCFEGAGEGVSYSSEVIAWAPGQGAVEYPGGTGVRVAAGTKMVLQVHYNLVDPATRGQRDQTAVDLRLEDSVAREAFVTLPDLFLGGYASVDEIPPGQSDAVVEFDLPFEWLVSVPIELELLGVMPHMHERGRRMSVEIVHADGADDTCVAEVQNWSFAWQRVYFYDEPIRFGSRDTLRVKCVYDTSADTEPILAGWGTQNEMCLPALYVALAR